MKLRLYSSFAVLIIFITSAPSVALARTAGEARVFDLVNRQRASARLRTLVWDDRLARLAREYSHEMARDGFFDHYDRRGRTVVDRAQAARIRNWTRIGENLFVCDPHELFAQSAIRGWMRSMTHRENLLDGGWTATGIGIATSADGSIFITQVFTE